MKLSRCSDCQIQIVILIDMMVFLNNYWKLMVLLIKPSSTYSAMLYAPKRNNSDKKARNYFGLRALPFIILI
jgi:hypothetical protein